MVSLVRAGSVGFEVATELVFVVEFRKLVDLLLTFLIGLFQVIFSE